ncbi:MAG: serine dehydratase [Acidaminobacter sp.]|uniref:L-serine ammonia-lyase, iron-sulfur-dependent, subunit alpha n=1 Tax=Acidaminobacter sp. TaxID=1872102 RepID=UPI00137F7771|nr:L-serine ammonia-lyase, iron-sulfur-dependent, subunit alpha [Acidaminobacter sp.]MZQ99556.1 serine dehydratase [Acidaminobacter sp.]
MQKLPASIFNDVIGPVMRGPSSSHVAGAARIGSIIRQSLDSEPKRIVVEFDVNGSLAESYHGHGSDIGFASGILGIELTDNLVKDACEIAKRRGIDIQYIISDYGAEHPNNYRIEVYDQEGNFHEWEAISVGGGMIEVVKLDGFKISICGDFFEIVLLIDEVDSKFERILENVKKIIGDYEDLVSVIGLNQSLINIKTSLQVDVRQLEELKSLSQIVDMIVLKPILPTLSSANCKVPFLTATDLLELAIKDKKEMWEMAVLYESIRGNTNDQEVINKMNYLIDIMEKSIEEGLAGTTYSDRILGPQAYKIENGIKSGSLVPADVLNQVIKSITAIMEVKSSMGVIVAAPTAGSCGCLPGTLLGVGKTLGMTRDEIVKGMLAAGLIGVFISEGATFSAEVAGCQVECGAGSGMAAAGLVQMFKGTVEQCVDAASIALQNVTGLACDPVANRVEVPCLGKNIMGGSNAIASANMALAGYDKVIPLDETIAAMYDIGLKLPLELRCTFGGLGKTNTSVNLAKLLL